MAKQTCRHISRRRPRHSYTRRSQHHSSRRKRAQGRRSPRHSCRRSLRRRFVRRCGQRTHKVGKRAHEECMMDSNSDGREGWVGRAWRACAAGGIGESSRMSAAGFLLLEATSTDQWSQLDPELRRRRTRAPVSDSSADLQPLTAGRSTARCVRRTSTPPRPGKIAAMVLECRRRQPQTVTVAACQPATCLS